MEKQRESSSMAMRLFATWDVDRATPSTVPRIFNVSINRILLDGVPPQLNSIIVTAKLPMSKRNRNLRSNEIKVTPNHGRIDLECDISYSIQYPHFLKRKANILQLIIQRRRKYKNRLPGGFKDLAIGNINLTYVMQQGGLREISLNAADGELELKGAGLCVGRMMLTSCYSQAPERVDERDKPKKVTEDSDEDTETDYDDAPLDDLNEVPTSARSNRHKNAELDNPRRRSNKNLKQKFAKLIRRFNKMPVEEVAEVASTSGARQPTAKELEALFEELSDFSDSGPEMMNDDISICSNPRPCLEPFFARSREVLPAISDGQEVDASESEGEREEGGWSSETDNTKENVARSKLAQKDSVGSNHTDALQTPHKGSLRIVPTYESPLQLPHSSTSTSLGKNPINDVQRGISLSEQLSSILGSNISSVGDSVWLCNLVEWPSFSGISGAIPLVSTSSSSQVRQTISHIVNRIQNYCHSNSSNPPLTCVGIIGTDRIFSQVLRAYVDCLAHKSSSNWINYLRFIPVPSTNSLFYKLIEGIDPMLDILCRDVWDRFGDMTGNERNALMNKLVSFASNRNSSRLNLPIGEAMLQLVADRDPEGGRVFLPFLCEVRVGNQQLEVATDEDSGGNGNGGNSQGVVTSPREEKESRVDGSPPNSPHMRNVDGQELSVDFWVNNSIGNTPTDLVFSNLEKNTTPNSKKDASKVTLKAHFKTLLISRHISSGALSLIYLKEKRKDKMLQKLGMKKGQKQRSDGDGTPSQVLSIGRMLCSASGKHNELTVIVDGTAYTGIRYFQTSPQWQTHVKSFPIALLSSNICIGL